MTGPMMSDSSDSLDPGIARAVDLLNTVDGIKTYESCEGGDGHTYHRPTVRFYGSLGVGWAGLSICMDHALPVFDLSRVWDIDDGEPSGPFWQITFRHKMDADYDGVAQ